MTSSQGTPPSNTYSNLWRIRHRMHRCRNLPQSFHTPHLLAVPSFFQLEYWLDSSIDLPSIEITLSCSWYIGMYGYRFYWYNTISLPTTGSEHNISPLLTMDGYMPMEHTIIHDAAILLVSFSILWHGVYNPSIHGIQYPYSALYLHYTQYTPRERPTEWSQLKHSAEEAYACTFYPPVGT